MLTSTLHPQAQHSPKGSDTSVKLHIEQNLASDQGKQTQMIENLMNNLWNHNWNQNVSCAG